MRRNWMRYLARALALVWAGWWTLFGVLAGIGEGLDPAGIFMHSAVPGGLFLIAVALAWRWEAAGTGLLLVAGVLTMVVFPFARTLEGFLTLAAPPILAGGLFFADWTESLSTSAEPFKPKTRS